MGDCRQGEMAEQLHPFPDHRPQTGQVETLETISNQRAGTYQPEGLGGPFEKEMGGTPPCTLNPHSGEIAHLAPLRADNEEQEFHDLLGDTRFRTLRQRCLVLEQMIKRELPIPWRECHVRELLNRLRAQEVTPHKLQLCWDTSWGICPFFLRAMSSGKKGDPCSPFFQSPDDFFGWNLGFPGWLYHCKSESCLNGLLFLEKPVFFLHCQKPKFLGEPT